jgi:predicted DNA-binding protein YlxM (UPF0122 family)
VIVLLGKIERMAMLFDFYGKLLTDKQQEILTLHYEQDFSLGEIADEYKVSRQAIHDILKRGEKLLEGYEEKLRLVYKFETEREKLAEVLKLLNEIIDIQQN